MDNFHLQVTPVELTYQSKDPVVLSCLIKKVMPSGGAPERYQVRPSSELSAGRATFHQGATFALSKEMELSSTRISLNFFNKNDRNPCLIGSTDLDVASLPPHPYTLLQLKLDHCNDPKARLKLQIQRKETQLKHMKKETVKSHEMGILRTQGQIKEEAMIGRRVNPTIPTAYQISRRNYKQVEFSCHQDKKSEGRKYSNSSKKGSYLQQRVALQAKTNRIPVKNEERAGESPIPRRQTPQPIRIGKAQQRPPAQQVSKYAISKGGKATHSHTNSVHTQPNLPIQESDLEPQKLQIKPYGEDQNINKVNQATIKSLEEQKNQKFENIRNIVEKFQLIHDKIVQSKDRSQGQSETPSQNMSNYHKSYFEDRESHPAAVNSFSHLNTSNQTSHLNTSKILQDSASSSSQKGQKMSKEEPINLEKQFQNIKSVKTKSPDASPPSEKTITFKNNNIVNIEKEKPPQEQEMASDRENQLIQIQANKQEINALKSDLASALRSLAERDRTITTLHSDLDHYKLLLEQKQTLLSKLTQQYQIRFEEIFALKERVAAFQEEHALLKKAKSTGSQPRKSEESKTLAEQLAKAKKRIVEVQSQLRFKQNENKCLVLQLDNMKREKAGLEQEVKVLVSRDKNQMTRKASLARIEQINSNSLANHAKRENEALRSQVKLLQQKLESLNALFQSLLSPADKEKTMLMMPAGRDTSEAERRAKLMQQKCGLLEQQLKQKKNQLAQIINIIWKHQDGDIMNDVLNLISAETPPA